MLCLQFETTAIGWQGKRGQENREGVRAGKLARPKERQRTDPRFGKAAGGAVAGGAVGALVGSLPGAAIGAGVGASLILAASGQRSTSKTDTRTNGGESHWGESLSEEQQISVALELERIAERHTDRLMKAANVGQWETAITFATETTAGRNVLTGALLGELAKPSTDVYPPRVHHDNLTAQHPLLLPKRDDKYSTVFPTSLASYLTSEELASISAPPSENLPGYEIRRAPALSLTDARPIAPGRDPFPGSCLRPRSSA